MGEWKSIKIIAGIVTYNPDIKRLEENLNALKRQVQHIIIVDNGSLNIDEILILLSRMIEVDDIIKFQENKGIAAALRRIMNYASNRGYEWVLSLDQDSIIEPGLVDIYRKSAVNRNNSQVGMFTCLIKDRNFEDKNYEIQKRNYEDVPYCITSAAFTNVDKYFSTTGYDQSFFIDCVDFDICYLLREAGYVIRRVNFKGLYHEVGHGENRYFLWKKIVVYHQNPLRIYYLTRNTVWMYRKHQQLISPMCIVKKLTAIFIRIILYEDLKIEKLNNFFIGLKDSKNGAYDK